jgi:hypothetical protein
MHKGSVCLKTQGNRPKAITLVHTFVMCSARTRRSDDLNATAYAALAVDGLTAFFRTHTGTETEFAGSLHSALAVGIMHDNCVLQSGRPALPITTTFYLAAFIAYLASTEDVLEAAIKPI